jgi:hypothetical protein
MVFLLSGEFLSAGAGAAGEGASRSKQHSIKRASIYQIIRTQPSLQAHLSGSFVGRWYWSSECRKPQHLSGAMLNADWRQVKMIALDGRGQKMPSADPPRAEVVAVSDVWSHRAVFLCGSTQPAV